MKIFVIATINIAGRNTGLSSQYLVELDNLVIGEADYTSDFQVSLPANNQDITLTFKDSADGDCTIELPLDAVAPCSPECGMSITEWTIIDCQDNGTNSDSEDDLTLVQFEVTVSNVSFSPSQFNVFVDDILQGTFGYNQIHQLNFPSDGQARRISFVDITDGTCLLEQDIDLEPCSFVPLPSIYIPNVFNISSEGGNANWEIFSTYEEIQFIECYVYDRWGNVQFFSDNPASIIWDGTSDGKMLNQGVYTYKLSYVISEEVIVDYGTITLLR